MNISILTKIESKGGNEWRFAEYITSFIQKGHSVNIYCRRDFNNTIKKYICNKVGNEWIPNVYENLNFKIKCREQENIIISPVDDNKIGNYNFVSNLLEDKKKINKVIVNVNWPRSDVSVLRNIVGKDRTLFLCANSKYENIFSKQRLNSIYLPTPISEDFCDTKINYKNINIGRHSRGWKDKFSTVYLDLIKNNPQLNFILMGMDKVDKNKLKEVKNIKIYNEFQLDAKDYLQEIGIFLHIPKKRCYDMSPRVVQEAMMAGLPVVTENRAGMKNQIINNVNGLLFNRENKNELTKIILNLISNKELRQRLGKQARITAKKDFSTTKIVDKIIHFLEK